MDQKIVDNFRFSGQAEVFGIQITGFENLTNAAEYILNLISKKEGGCAVAMNAQKLVLLKSDAALLKFVGQASINYPDGVGAIMALKRKGVVSKRIAGADLWLEIIERSALYEKPLRIAILGGRETVLQSTVSIICDRYPTVDVAFARNGYEGMSDKEEVVRKLISSSPDIVFVAMGSPRQELLIESLMPRLPSSYFLGLGGSLDVFTGTTKRAPLWVQSAGFEWLYRLLLDYRKIPRLKSYAVFVVRLVFRKF